MTVIIAFLNRGFKAFDHVTSHHAACIRPTHPSHRPAACLQWAEMGSIGYLQSCHGWLRQSFCASQSCECARIILVITSYICTVKASKSMMQMQPQFYWLDRAHPTYIVYTCPSPPIPPFSYCGIKRSLRILQILLIEANGRPRPAGKGVSRNTNRRIKSSSLHLR